MLRSSHAALVLKTPIRITKCRHNSWYFCYFRLSQWEERPFNGPTKRITSWHLEIDQRNAVVPHTMGWKANICWKSHLIKGFQDIHSLMQACLVLWAEKWISHFRVLEFESTQHQCGNNYMVLCIMSKQSIAVVAKQMAPATKPARCDSLTQNGWVSWFNRDPLCTSFKKNSVNYQVPPSAFVGKVKSIGMQF